MTNEIMRYTNIAEHSAAAMTYLNPAHGSNYDNATLLPDGTPGRAYIFKTQWTMDVTPATVGGTTAVTIGMIPFVEYPFFVTNPAGATIYAVPTKKMLGSNLVPTQYLKDNGVYAYRCIGKSYTLYDQTPDQLRGGSITTGHKQPDTDLNNGTLTDGIGRTVYGNNWAVQRVPTATDQLTEITTCRIGKPLEGVYATAHHVTNDFTVRNLNYNKINSSLLSPVVSADQCNILQWTDYSGGAKSVKDIANQTLPVVVSAPDNTDVVITCLDNLQVGASFQIKFTTVWEFVLKVSSPWYADTVARPLANYSLMEALRTYECWRSMNLAGSGAMAASANDWNEIWSGFKHFISRIGDVGRNVAANFGIRSGSDLVGAIAKAAPFALAML